MVKDIAVIAEKRMNFMLLYEILISVGRSLLEYSGRTNKEAPLVALVCHRTNATFFFLIKFHMYFYDVLKSS